MTITMRPLEKIIPYARNARRIPPEAVDKVAASIREFGWRQPIVVDRDGVIIAGHTRLLAAQKLGLREAPVHVAENLTPAQVRAYRLLDNRSHEESSWDEDLLALELLDLKGMEIDLDLTGFDSWEIEKLLWDEEDDRADLIPEPLAEPVSRSGDLWTLGGHRVLCGDSASKEDVGRLVEGQCIDLVHADPPYNVSVEPRSNNAIAAGISSFVNLQHHQKLDWRRHPSKAKPTSKKMRPKDRALENDFIQDADYDVLLRRWFGNLAGVLRPGGSFYLWGGYANCANYPAALAECGLYFSQAIIWVKEHPVLTRKDFMGNHEWCFYGWREGAAHWFHPEISNATNVWSVKKVNPNAMVHLTEKPVELAVRALTYSSQAGQKVLDLFGGSGSTLIAAEKLGRRARLMEIDPPYCDIIVLRWQQYTGHKGVRDIEVQIRPAEPPSNPRSDR
jgi:DNA modification methylase